MTLHDLHLSYLLLHTNQCLLSEIDSKASLAIHAYLFWQNRPLHKPFTKNPSFQSDLCEVQSNDRKMNVNFYAHLGVSVFFRVSRIDLELGA